MHAGVNRQAAKEWSAEEAGSIPNQTKPSRAQNTELKSKVNAK